LVGYAIHEISLEFVHENLTVAGNLLGVKDLESKRWQERGARAGAKPFKIFS
jgi:hypothetical protein